MGRLEELEILINTLKKEIHSQSKLLKVSNGDMVRRRLEIVKDDVLALEGYIIERDELKKQ